MAWVAPSFPHVSGMAGPHGTFHWMQRGVLGDAGRTGRGSSQRKLSIPNQPNNLPEARVPSIGARRHSGGPSSTEPEPGTPPIALSAPEHPTPAGAEPIDRHPDPPQLTRSELRTLRVKVAHMAASTLRVAEYLARHPRVERVEYLGLSSHPLHPLAARYMHVVDDGTPAFGHLLSFDVRGSAADTRRFFDGLQRIWRATDLGRVKSVATIPAISTHQQQGEEGRQLAGISPTMVRLCVGAEHPEDIIGDLEQALARLG